MRVPWTPILYTGDVPLLQQLCCTHTRTRLDAKYRWLYHLALLALMALLSPCLRMKVGVTEKDHSNTSNASNTSNTSSTAIRGKTVLWLQR